VPPTDTLAEARLRQAHPWHGVQPDFADFELTAFIENTPFDEVKYEVDQATGWLKIDGPMPTSSLTPYAYGFVPGTLIGSRVAKLTKHRHGDHSAVDVFVISERNLQIPGVLAQVRLVGGIPVHDDLRTDDKLVCVLNNDAAFGHVEDINALPIHIVERICHFLSSSSLMQSSQVGDPYGRARARTLLLAAIEDYQDTYGT
jgi:inorganic pyrophosphatase